MTPSGQTICLNMIVKNEAPVILRCLASVRPLIDSWVIVDTGSEDGTQQMIRDFLADVPGELHERPWVDFAHNRSEALRLAHGRADYVFVIDADEVLEIEPGFALPDLSVDSFNLLVRYGSVRYLRRQLVKNSLPWRYEGVLHEYITCTDARTEQFLPGLTTVPHHDGARARDPLTYKKDADVLERALEADPDNTRYTFYLAQSYRDAGDFENALRVYRRRAELGGWREEVWFSLFQVAQIRHRLDHHWPEVMESHLAAWQVNPGRAETLYRIAMHYQAKAEYNVSWVFLRRALEVSIPGPEGLFVEHALYAFQIALDYAVAAYYVGEHEAAIATNNRILTSGHLPTFAVDQVIRNRRFSLDFLYRQNAVTREQLPPLRVIVPAHSGSGAPAPEIDECLDSLARQRECNFTVTILTRPGVDLRGRLPAQVPAAEIVTTTATDLWSGIEEHLRAEVPNHEPGREEEIVAVLPPSFSLASPDSLSRLANLFQDARCHIAYGQHRNANGSLGHARPPASAATLAAESSDLTAGAPVLFSSALLCDSSRPLNAMQLLRAAGFDAIRFSDEVDAVSNAASTLPQIAAPASAPARLPLISCLMVTYDRLALARRSIMQFARQTYPERELVIVTDGAPVFRDALERYAAALGLANVRVVAVDGERRPLGQLRNIAMDAARGEILCQWDDDDSNHPDRLMIQAGHMLRQNAAACLLADHLQLIEEKRALCWIDWGRGTNIVDPDHVAPGTLMMLRNPGARYPESGPYCRQGEDSVLLHVLCQSVPVVSLVGEGHLYLYRFHGNNTFSRDHHYNLASFRLGAETMREREQKLRAAARFYDLPEPCCVLGREGPLFVLDR